MSYGTSTLVSSSWWRSTAAPSCTPEELAQIITAPSGGHYVIPTDPYNEVYPGIYLGDGTTALCTHLLRRMGITHVLNAACGKDKTLYQINTNAEFYRECGMKFMGIEAIDAPYFRLEPYFEQAANFIDEALQSGGKVFVHCRAGISRSATLVLAYLMMKRNMTAQEATRVVRRRREIIPNIGFMRQLCNLNERLVRERRLRGSGYGVTSTRPIAVI